MAVVFSFHNKLDAVGLALGLCVGCYVFMFTTLMLVLTTKWVVEVDKARARLGLPPLPMTSTSPRDKTAPEVEMDGEEIRAALEVYEDKNVEMDSLVVNGGRSIEDEVSLASLCTFVRRGDA